MEKTKLKDCRLSKGYSQKQLADKLCINVPNYARRENGEAKICNTEWERLSDFLETPLENIYEADETMVFIFNDNSNGNGENQWNHFENLHL